MRFLEIDEQHANLAIPHQIAHGIEHAVAVVAGKRDRLIVNNANKPRVAALVRHSWSALVIDSREEKHIPTFDERLMLRRNFRKHVTFFDIVSKPSCVEALLQRAMVGSILTAHRHFPYCKKTILL